MANDSAYKPFLGSDYENKFIVDKFSQPEQVQDSSSGSLDRESKLAIAKSAQSSGAAGGGLGGMLTSGGMTAGLMGAGPVGWGVMGGGLLLSAIEKNKQEKAAREQAQIDAEMQKRQNLIALARDAANTDFRIA